MNQHEPSGIAAILNSAAGRERLAELIARLGRGDDAAEIAGSEGVTAREILAAVVMPWLDGDGLALVRSPRQGRPIAGIDPDGMSRLFPDASAATRLSLLAGLLQVIDQWDLSHQAAQEADELGERDVSPYWHAIAHRREPDPGNAGYWFRRVGRHPAFADVARAAGPILDDHGDARLKARLMPGGAWDPMAYVAFCGEAARRPGSEEERVARRIQRAEMIALLDATMP